MDVSLKSEWKRKGAKSEESPLNSFEKQHIFIENNANTDINRLSSELEMLSKGNKNEVDSIGVDKAVSDLSEEELRDVLEQVIDHKIPESEKCPLVRRLTEKAKDESSLEPCFGISSLPTSLPPFTSSLPAAAAVASGTPTSSRGSRRTKSINQKGLSKEAEHSLNSSKQKKNVHSSQSLQDLASFCGNYFLSSGEKDTFAMKASGGKKPQRGTFANSTEVSQTPTCSGKTESDFLSNLGKRSPCAPGKSSTVGSVTTINNVNRGKSKSSKTKQTFQNPVCAVTTECQTPTAVACDREVKGAEPSPVTLLSSSLSSASASSYTSSTSQIASICKKTEVCDNGQPNSKLKLEVHMPEEGTSVFEEKLTTDIEMKDLSKRAEIVEYSSKGLVNCNYETVSEEKNLLTKRQNNYSSVDTFAEIPGLTTGGPVDTLFAERVINHCPGNYTDGSDKTDGFLVCDDGKSVLSLRDIGNGSAVIAARGNQSHQPKTERKKRKSEATKLAEQIEGHIGYKDVDFLTSYVSGGEKTKPSEMGVTASGVSKLNGSSCGFEAKSVTSNPCKENSNRKKEKASSNGSGALSINGGRKKCYYNSGTGCETDQKSVNGLCESMEKSIPSTDSHNLSDDAQCSDVTEKVDFTRTNTILENADMLSTAKKFTRKGTSSYTSAASDKLDMSNFASDDEQSYPATDSEMPEQEAGFQVIKPKHYRRRRGLRKEGFLPLQRSSLPSGASSMSTTPSFASSTSNNAATARGYESEREYCADEYRKRQERQLRRKMACSMPHSEQNSADNSDVESSCSYPVSRRGPASPSAPSNAPASSISSTPKASYADIAKIGSAFVALPNATASIAFRTNSLPANCAKSLEKPIKVEDDQKVESKCGISTVKKVECPLELSTASPSPEEDKSKTIEALVSPLIAKTSASAETNSSASSPEAVDTRTKSLTPSQMRKSNSIPESAVKESVLKSSSSNKLKSQTSVCSLPAVIMYDDVNTVDDVKSSFTFGFFDDDVTYPVTEAPAVADVTDPCASITTENVDEKVNDSSQKQPSLQTQFPKKLNFSIKPPSADVDMGSFNYSQIISYIRSAWEKVLREYQAVSSDGLTPETIHVNPDIIPRHVTYYQLSQ